MNGYEIERSISENRVLSYCLPARVMLNDVINEMAQNQDATSAEEFAKDVTVSDVVTYLAEQYVDAGIDPRILEKPELAADFRRVKGKLAQELTTVLETL